MRAPDKWESARFLAFCAASSFSHFQTESTPAHLRVTLAVSPPFERYGILFLGYMYELKF